ncbi:MAG: hydrogenase [Epsilonproteobacteria bacterium]|nr:hydrogenase [Campylobacterota bacterium]
MKSKVLWIQGITCNGNTQSFLNYPNMEYLLDRYDFLYHPFLDSSLSVNEALRYDKKFDFLIVEGAVSKEFIRAGENFYQSVKKLAKNAKYILALGTCAVYGGIFKEKDPKNITGVLYDKDEEKGLLKEFKDKVVNIPGCPAHPEWIVFVLDSLKDRGAVITDELKRPKEIYGYLTHHGCTRNEYFEWKVDSKDFGTKEGCLFYLQGCRAPTTHGSCNRILWNEVNSKTRSGSPCFGCTESSFPRSNMFETKTFMSIPADLPVGVSKRAYLTVTGIAKTFHIKRLKDRLI